MARYYRVNKYGEKIEVENWTCGSCELYNLSTGKCDAYNVYCSKEDDACHCSVPYSMSSDVHSFGWF